MHHIYACATGAHSHNGILVILNLEFLESHRVTPGHEISNFRFDVLREEDSLQCDERGKV